MGAISSCRCFGPLCELRVSSGRVELRAKQALVHPPGARRTNGGPSIARPESKTRVVHEPRIGAQLADMNPLSMPFRLHGARRRPVGPTSPCLGSSMSWVCLSVSKKRMLGREHAFSAFVLLGRKSGFSEHRNTSTNKWMIPHKQGREFSHTVRVDPVSLSSLRGQESSHSGPAHGTWRTSRMLNRCVRPPSSWHRRDKHRITLVGREGRLGESTGVCIF